MTKPVHEPLLHLAKRTEVNSKRAWLIRIAAFLLSILACAVISVILIEDRGMDFFFNNFFKGVFGDKQRIWNLLHGTSILLIIALAVTPCFKMRFWNIGGEGQVLMGALGCAVIINFYGGSDSSGLTIFLSLLVSVLFGIAWAVIPSLFKAKWNTNETLLTLMMNYIAVCLSNFFIKSVATSGTGILTFMGSKGIIGPIQGNEYILKIIVVAVVTACLALYLKYSKHGYELTVVGESERTAKYIGINTGKVIVRTLILCGAICGLAGFLLVSATNHSFGSSTVGGKGFIGVLISWLAHFNPLAMVLTSFLYVFIEQGSTQVGNMARLGDSYASVMTGVFFFFIIATEFFNNYKIVVNKSVLKKGRDDESLSDGNPDANATEESAEDRAEFCESQGDESISDNGDSGENVTTEILSDDSVLDDNISTDVSDTLAFENEEDKL